MMGFTRKINSSSGRVARGFTLIELLVVIGIIGMLMALLMPALAKARLQGLSVKCKSNLRQLGIVLTAYMNENKGWLFPVGPEGPDGLPTTYGTNVPPHERWPMRVAAFQIRPPDPLPYNPSAYTGVEYDPEKFPVAPFTPAILVCPLDIDPQEAHSYVLNQHLADKRIKFGSTNFGGRTSAEVIVAGEKKMTERDYYMERAEFERIVEKFQHGAKLGSNYLFFDGHVDNAPPRQAAAALDPWDLKLPVVPDKPGN